MWIVIMDDLNLDFTLIRVFIAVILAFVSTIICYLFPRKWIWIGATSGFVAGFLFVFTIEHGVARGIVFGIIFGVILSFSLVVTGNRTFSSAKKAWDEIKMRK